MIWAFLAWEKRRLAAGRSALLDPAMLRIPKLQKGLIAFFFQFLLQAGLFFCVPLYLSVALGLSAIDTGLRIMPLSITLLLAAVGVPKLFPQASPRRVVRLGFLALFVGIVVAGGRPRGRASARRSSRCRCSSPGSASAPWPRSSGR